VLDGELQRLHLLGRLNDQVQCPPLLWLPVRRLGEPAQYAQGDDLALARAAHGAMIACFNEAGLVLSSARPADRGRAAEAALVLRMDVEADRLRRVLKRLGLPSNATGVGCVRDDARRLLPSGS
jgi:hypothetical protein